MRVGSLLAVGAAGGVLGSFLADRVVAGRRHRDVLTWSLAVTAGSPVLLILAPRVWAAVAVLVITSGSFAVLNVTAVSLRQCLVPSDLLGRVSAAGRTLSCGAATAGALGGGALASGAGLDAPFLFSGVVAVVATLAWWLASRPAAGAVDAGPRPGFGDHVAAALNQPPIGVPKLSAWGFPHDRHHRIADEVRPRLLVV
ncbi:MAG TPA: MFS transporter [Jiangellales bacterium]|nr:MFS transporter [Jiangellales bacterium]